MNHVSISALRWIRRAFIAYSAHFLVGYGLVFVLFHTGVKGTHSYTPILAGLVIFQLLCELVINRLYAQRVPWMAVWFSLGFGLVETGLAAAGGGQLMTAYGIAAIVVSGIGGYLLWQFSKGGPNTSAKLDSMLHLEQVKSNLIIDSIDDGVVLIDEARVIRLFNPAAKKITGWDSNDATGLDYGSVFKLVDDKGQLYTKEKDPFLQVFEKSAAVHDNSAALISHDGKQIAVTISASPLLDTKNKITGVVGVFRDVSAERGQEKRSADFVSTASHEMRTPVAAIEGYLALALNDRVSTIDSKAREYLEKAHESTQHLGKLFQDLLTSTKAEDGRLSSHPSVIEMSGFTEKVVEDLRFSAEKKGLHMEYVMGTHDANITEGHNAPGGGKVIKPFYYVHADPERIREVVTNLFDNAVKYTETGGVTIGLTGNKDVVQLSVQDTGPGIPATDIPHLFQKFYRVDSSATRTIGGTGLGLFICSKIVELYQGRIWVESKVGQGSTFYINLPRLDDAKAKELQASEAAASPGTPLPTKSAT